MRSLQELVNSGTRTWFYLSDQDTKHQFVQDLKRLGAGYWDGSPVTPENCGPILSVHPDLKVAHLSIMIWNASFMPDFQKYCTGDMRTVQKVDYARYIDGESDFICRYSEFIPMT